MGKGLISMEITRNPTTITTNKVTEVKGSTTKDITLKATVIITMGKAMVKDIRIKAIWTVKNLLFRLKFQRK